MVQFDFGDSNPQYMDYETNSLSLSYLTFWWMGIKVAYIESQICLFTNQSSIRNCLKMANCEHAISNKMLCKNSSNINISFHRCFFDTNVTRKLQQQRILSVLIPPGRKMSWNYWKLTKLLVSINSHILLYVLVLYMWKII